ncbi:MAG: GFA family protein [Phyllobacteriaceae bacterium]|nr:GFA family protein [Phyllobacteriaceae bacterium]
MTATSSSGGCQCGAVRFRAEEVGDAGFCHCRMCQKAFGGPGAALISVPVGKLEWTRGRPAEFRSSPVVARGFCAGCGTPLYMLEDGWPVYDMAMGAFDDPAALPAPDHQVGIESKLPWFDSLHRLPGRRTDEDRAPADLARLRSLQHPDRDTAQWPDIKS